MSATDRLDAKSTALILNDLQLAIIAGSPLAPAEPEAVPDIRKRTRTRR